MVWPRLLRRTPLAICSCPIGWGPAQPFVRTERPHRTAVSAGDWGAVALDAPTQDSAASADVRIRMKGGDASRTSYQ